MSDKSEKKFEGFKSDYVIANVEHFPMVYINVLDKKPTSKEVDDYIAYTELLYAQPTPFVMIIEFPKKTIVLNAKERIKFGNWIRDNTELMRKCKACAFLLANPLMNIVIKGIFLIQTPVYDHIVTNTETKAKEWIDKKAKEYDIVIPERKEIE